MTRDIFIIEEKLLKLARQFVSANASFFLVASFIVVK